MDESVTRRSRTTALFIGESELLRLARCGNLLGDPIVYFVQDEADAALRETNGTRKAAEFDVGINGGAAARGVLADSA